MGHYGAVGIEGVTGKGCVAGIVGVDIRHQGKLRVLVKIVSAAIIASIIFPHGLNRH